MCYSQNRSVFALIIVLLLGCVAPVLAAQNCDASLTSTTPNGRFDNNGETVTDNKTDLMWSKCAEGLSDSGCTTGYAKTYNWHEAKERAKGSRLAGHADWRLPNLDELASLVESTCYNPSINTTIFPNTPSSLFWSATTFDNDSYHSWVLSFYNGGGYTFNRGLARYVRLVRSGQ
jgi:hypothetical protein